MNLFIIFLDLYLIFILYCLSINFPEVGMTCDCDIKSFSNYRDTIFIQK